MKQTKSSLFTIKEQDGKIQIKPGKGTFLRMRFKYYPEYIEKGMKLIINDNNLKAVGWIKELYY